MNLKALSILQKVTKPKSREEVHEFLMTRHGSAGRENASADPSVLDDQARQFTAVKQKPVKARAY